MPLEIGLWRTDGKQVTRLSPTRVGLESDLEDYIESDPNLLGQTLMLIGRQVPTAHGGFIDLLAVDAEGVVHVLELKRDKTPRDVVAQALDYGSWVATLSRSDIAGIYEDYQPATAFDQAFAETFGDAPPDEINASQVMTIVAASVDAATERIVRFLNEAYGVPLNVVFFRHFEDNGASYLARTWLVDEEAIAPKRAAAKRQKLREPWNGSDWAVSFGIDGDERSWDDARRYGFVSAGGGRWYSRTLKNLPIGARIFTYIPKHGFVGIGTVTGTATPFEEATVDVDEAQVKLAMLPLAGGYAHPPSDDDDTAEYVVPVTWQATRPMSDAFWRSGLRTNQNSAWQLRSQFTIDEVQKAFGITDD